MQNKINQFKQLSQEFADRKGYEVEFTDIPTKHTSSFRATFKQNNIKKFGFLMFASWTVLPDEYNIKCSETKKYIGENLTLDQFKKTIEEL